MSDQRRKKTFSRWEAPAIAESPGALGPDSAFTNTRWMSANQEQVSRQRPYDEAFARGLDEGRRAGREEFSRRIRTLDALIDALREPLKHLDEQLEHELVSLVIAVARHVIRHEMKSDPELTVALVREATAILPIASRHLRLHLHPEDSSIVHEACRQSIEDGSWSIVEDSSLAPGECLVSTDASRVDARLDVRLARIAAFLLGSDDLEDDQG